MARDDLSLPQRHRGLRGSGLSRPRTSGDWRHEFVHPSWLFIGLFIALIGAGTLLLSLPFSVSSGAGATFLDALFTATSAATGTGLTVHDTATYWSPVGHWVLLGLFQIGGAGALVGSTVFLLRIASHVTAQERFLLHESLGVQSGRGILLLILGVIVYALTIEGIGAYVLASRLAATLPADRAMWLGVFHSASAFNNAGFAIMDMTSSPSDWLVQLTLLGLMVAGGVSLFVVVDLVRGAFRRPMSLDTKLVLIASAVLLAGGASAILVTEAGGSGALAGMPLPQRLLSALFHSASARTAGLATVDLSAFAQPTQLLLVAFMFIGGAAGSTAGGVKVNSVALLVAATWSYVRGYERLSVLGQPIHEQQVNRALAIVVLSLASVFVVTLLLGATEGPGLLPQLFEAVSAFSTTGFSLGITPTLSPLGKLLIILAMLVGRVGPLALAFALSQRHRPSQHRYVQEAVNLG